MGARCSLRCSIVSNVLSPRTDYGAGFVYGWRCPRSYMYVIMVLGFGSPRAGDSAQIPSGL